MSILSTIRAIAEFAQWWCRMYPLRQINQARKELRNLENEKEKLDQNPTPANFVKSKRLLQDIAEAKQFYEYLSDSYVKVSSRNKNTNS